MMSRSTYIWKRLVFKTLFSIVGLMLFVAQVSYKFYASASMPVFRSSVVGRHASTGDVSRADEAATLSLDKRFELKPSFALLTPVFHFLHYTAVATILPCFIAPKPVDNNPVLTPLRGPPPFRISIS